MTKMEAHDSSNGPDTSSVGKFLWAEINPIEQMQIAAKIARDPSYLKNNPQDLLIPALAVEVPIAHVLTTAKDIFNDGLSAVGNQGKAVSDFVDGVKDLTDGNFSGFFSHEGDVVMDNLRTVGDIVRMPWDLVRQPVEHLATSVADLAGGAFDAGKDLFTATVGDQAHLLVDGAKGIDDLVHLNFSGVMQDASSAVGHEVDAVENLVKAPVDAVKGVFHSVIDLF